MHSLWQVNIQKRVCTALSEECMNIVEVKTNWRNVKNYENIVPTKDFVEAYGTEVYEINSVFISYKNKDIIQARDWLSARCNGKYNLLARFSLKSNDRNPSYLGINHCFADQNDAALFKLMFS